MNKIFFIFLLNLNLFINTAYAGGFSNLDFGVRRSGMFASVARIDDVTAIFHNPAGLIFLDGNNIYMSFTGALLDLRAKLYDSDYKLHPEDHSIQPTLYYALSPFIGISTDLGQEDLRVALGVYAPNFYGAFLPEDEPTRYNITEGFFLAGNTTLALAYRINNKFYLGAGFSLIYVYFQTSRMFNTAVFSDPDKRFEDGIEKGDMPFDMDASDLTFAWNIGTILTPLDTFRIGISFTSGSPVTLTGNIKLKDLSGHIQETTHETEMIIPFTLRSGINWEFAQDFEFGFDFTFWNYQVFQEQKTILKNELLGIKEFRQPKNFKNSYNWGMGLMYHIIDSVDLMIGYQQDFTPIPTSTLDIDNPTQNMHGISLGSRWKINKSFKLGFAFVRNFYDYLDIKDNINNPPANMKGVGQNTEIVLDLNYNF